MPVVGKMFHEAQSVPPGLYKVHKNGDPLKNLEVLACHFTVGLLQYGGENVIVLR